MEEVWKDIDGFEGYYQVSNLGRVRSVDRVVSRCKKGKLHIKGKVLNPHRTKLGYLKVDCRKNGIRKSFFVHRLVAFSFIPLEDNKPEVNHKDGNKSNNKAINLEWCDRSGNVQHSWDNNLSTPRKTGQNVDNVKELYKKGLNFSEIAKATGYSVSSVARLLTKLKITSKGNNNYYKLNKSDVLKIREMYKRGKTLSEIKTMFNVTLTSIRNVVNYKTWKKYD